MTPQLTTRATRRRDVFEWTDFYVKTIGTALAVIAILQTAQTYKHDIEARLLDQKAKILDDALFSAQKVLEAQDYKSFRAAFDHYGLVKHGPVLATFGDTSKPYQKMVDLWNECFDLTKETWGKRNTQTLEKEYEDINQAFRDSLDGSSKGSQSRTFWHSISDWLECRLVGDAQFHFPVIPWRGLLGFGWWTYCEAKCRALRFGRVVFAISTLCASQKRSLAQASAIPELLEVFLLILLSKSTKSQNAIRTGTDCASDACGMPIFQSLKTNGF